MQDALKDGVFTPGHARAVLALPRARSAGHPVQCGHDAACRTVTPKKRHPLETARLVAVFADGGLAPVARSARAPKPACIKLAIGGFRNVAPKASISGTDRAGRITLPYESEEQLAELLSRLGLSVELSKPPSRNDLQPKDFHVWRLRFS